MAAADYTDDCRVRVELRKRRVTLTISEARALAVEIMQAIAEAEKGADELIRDVAPERFDRLPVPPIPPELVANEVPTVFNPAHTVWLHTSGEAYPSTRPTNGQFFCSCGWKGMPFTGAREERASAISDANKHAEGAA